MSLSEITAPSISLSPGATYYAKIQLTGAEAAFGTSADVAAKLSGLFSSVTVWDSSNVPALIPDRTPFPTGDTYWARGVYSGAARTAGLPSELKRVWLDVANQPVPSGGYTPPPDFVGPPEPDWNWPMAPSDIPAAPSDTNGGPTSPPTTPKPPPILIGVAVVAFIALALFTWREGTR